ncbi:UDP-N-acetylmuramoylalanyl-D-glutamyl-2,6-diaminopimelate--D-alanyl-D-alanine ligase [Sneathiella chinensis]|uniref:UDP-N-acetylmuramoyl-tripeptide--D-alanyl-D-alanine ligase n=1 Tax=Sneathiella chinensis TaxID=349750 RepID=A0ABQ5U1F4_9PROT|nr:UDP-N-acetylmuramoylalanyl-D-glutamyl-2,6-diaminopimelate--D-alanyl-D-alanine ligase [Sneathiella chinensis]GLQ06000.1 UDP-N-acetylmuramoyl-tripeptide--D-alanyl-D-alanine ligase [Sneathiella chinensis]
MTDHPLWHAREIIEATGGTCAQSDWFATGVSIDSRTVQAGELFVAIAGPNFDGHAFAGRALEAGAAAVLVSHVPEGMPAGANVVLVDDPLKALERLGRAARDRCRGRIIAVTGSVGKTGTKEALAHILKEQGKTHYSIGSFNNHWGVPLSLSRMPRDTEFGIFELGMNHPGELGPLSRMVRPHVAIVTTVAAAHLEFFTSVEEIAEAKAEIFEGLVPDGMAIINGDNDHAPVLKRQAEAHKIANICTFGEAGDADFRLEKAALNPDSSDIVAVIGGHRLDFTLAVAGRHWVQNILAVLGAVQAVGTDLEKAADSLSRMVAPSGRGVRLDLNCKAGRYQVIDESYNASPVAMRAAFQVLGAMTPQGGGRKIAVLGDMREMGEQSPEIHAALANDISECGIDMVYACGPNMRYLANALPQGGTTVWAEQSEGLVQPLIGALHAGDLVLIKGSLGSKMKVVLEALVAQSAQVESERQGGGQ